MRRHMAMPISMAALVVAVLGSTPAGEAAWNQLLPRSSVGPAQLQRDAVRSRHVLDGSLRAADFRRGQLPSEAAWAVVDRTGALQAGKGARSSRRVLTGIYTVTFDRPATHDCAVLATQRSADNGYASARPGGAGVSSVTVNLFATGGPIQRFDGAFSVAVLCAS